MDLSTLPRRGGHLALDFVNTIDPRYGDERVEYLGDYAALVEWAAWVGVLDDPGELRSREATAVHRRALRLREDLYALLRPARESPPDISRELRRAMSHLALRPSGDGYEEAFEGDDADRMLWPVVRAAAALATSPQLARVRECAGTDCGWLFLDASKAGRRRWCSMEVCGNRAKARRYRERAA
jgi:predicted RNA-binding Zn ribbon-like protein